MSRPAVFLTADWRYLAMLNYEVEPALLRPLVPPGTELDAWNGRVFVSVVGFLFLNTRVHGIGIPRHRDFEEVNLRFYVRREVGGEVRRGVAFIKEIVPRFAIAAVARLLYGENYAARPMRHVKQLEGDRLAPRSRLEYAWRQRGDWASLGVTLGDRAAPLAEGSEAEFITEHYWGYACRRGAGCTEYQVEHPRWHVWEVSGAKLDCDAAAVYGPQYAAPLAGRPSSAFVAEGSPVVVRHGCRVR